MKKILILIILQFIFSEAATGQNQAVNWYFGDSAGVSFSLPDYIPSAATDGKLFTWEGCAAISDHEGNLLFYTEGVTVLNSDHELMPNGTGLSGDESTTQSAIIVPMPLDLDKYYIFTVDNQARERGLRYSVIDMKLDGGSGGVDQKNIELTSPVTEKVTAVKHANGIDYWVIVHGWENNRFHSFRVTPE